MKLTILLLLTLIFQTAHACDENSSASDCKDSGVAIVEMSVIKELASVMCSRLVSALAGAGDQDEIGKSFETLVLNHLGIDREKEGYKLLITSFWNANSQDLICTSPFTGVRAPQHFMKRVVDMGMQNEVLYEFILYDPDDYPITVNHIEIYKGKKETILDFVQNILTTPGNEEKYDFKELESLRRILIKDYGAKYAKDL